MHGRGVVRLLLEHLVSLAPARGVKVFTADALAANSAVLQVLNDAGRGWLCGAGSTAARWSYPCRSRSTALGEASPYLDAVAGREKRAAVASLEPLLAPRSAAVVGAGHQPGSIGRMILLNIRDAGFGGALYAVNPHAGAIEGVPCVPSVAALPEAPTWWWRRCQRQASWTWRANAGIAAPDRW
jgi:CoA binding domain